MKFITNCKTQKVLILLALTLSTLHLSTQARKNNRRRSKNADLEKQLIKSNLDCRGIHNLFKSNKDPNMYISVWHNGYQENHNVVYTSHIINEGEINTRTLKNHIGPIKKYEEDLKEKYTKIEIYEEFKNLCGQFCVHKAYILSKVFGRQGRNVWKCSESATYFYLHPAWENKIETAKVTDEKALKINKEMEDQYSLHVVAEKKSRRRFF